jgi:HAMP domain-containing protein
VHRVGPDSSGALDSVRTDAAGRYTIRYRRFGSDEAVYFAAAVHHGIAYFSSPLRGPRVSAHDAEIVVFDTTSGPVRLTVQGHHIVVGAPKPDGGRDIVEVYEISNDSTVTLVGRDSLAAIWSAPIPREATGFVAGQGDVAAVTLQRRGDRVTLAAAFGPGVKQLSYSYTLPPSAFPLTFELERATSVLEVLLEEPEAQVRAASLRAMPNASTEGRNFKRFVGQSAPAGERIRIDVPVTTASTRTRVLIGLAIVIALAMAATLARALTRRPRLAVAIASSQSVQSLAAEIAALDARHDSGDPSIDEERYAMQRAVLKAQLAKTLADKDSGS